MSVMKTNVYVKANLNSLIPFLTKSVKDYLKTGGYMFYYAPKTRHIQGIFLRMGVFMINVSLNLTRKKTTVQETSDFQSHNYTLNYGSKLASAVLF